MSNLIEAHPNGCPSPELSAEAGLPPSRRHSMAASPSSRASELSLALGIGSLNDAILHTVLYADLFDFPLTVREIHRFLIGYEAPAALVASQLAANRQLRERLHTRPPYWFLSGRGSLVELRREREAYSKRLWRMAWSYGHLMAIVPFVRLVALTGSLAMNNVHSADDDVDLLLATASGRTWLARAMAISIVRLAYLHGVRLCPNYVVAENCLELHEPSLFAAHEVAQMVPLFGARLYERLLNHNGWVRLYLPNSGGYGNATREIGRLGRVPQRIGETVLSGRLGASAEIWERTRKIAILRREAEFRGASGAAFTTDMCKGHMDDHAALVQGRYLARLAAQ